MTISNKAINQMAYALVPEVIDYIYADERWVDFMIEMVQDALKEKLGELDVDLSVELGQSIMDRVTLNQLN